MSFEYTTDVQCSRSFCSDYWASNETICEQSVGSVFNKVTWTVSDQNDCGFEIRGGSIFCSQKCDDSSSGESPAVIVGIVVAVLAAIALVAYRRGWWTFSCNKNDATTEDEKGDITGGDLEDSQTEGDAAIPVETSKTSGDVKQANLQI